MTEKEAKEVLEQWNIFISHKEEKIQSLGEQYEIIKNKYANLLKAIERQKLYNQRIKILYKNVLIERSKRIKAEEYSRLHYHTLEIEYEIKRTEQLCEMIVKLRECGSWHCPGCGNNKFFYEHSEDENAVLKICERCGFVSPHSLEILSRD